MISRCKLTGACKRAQSHNELHSYLVTLTARSKEHVFHRCVLDTGDVRLADVSSTVDRVNPDTGPRWLWDKLVWLIAKLEDGVALEALLHQSRVAPAKDKCASRTLAVEAAGRSWVCVHAVIGAGCALCRSSRFLEHQGSHKLK